MTSIQNRNNSFVDVLDKISDKQKGILVQIGSFPNSTAQDIATRLRIPINEVTGRITELKEIFAIAESGSKKNVFTRKENTTYKVISPDERINLVNREFVYLREQKDQLVNDYNKDISQFTLSFVKREINKISSKIKALEGLILTE